MSSAIAPTPSSANFNTVRVGRAALLARPRMKLGTLSRTEAPAAEELFSTSAIATHAFELAIRPAIDTALGAELMPPRRAPSASCAQFTPLQRFTIGRHREDETPSGPSLFHATRRCADALEARPMFERVGFKFVVEASPIVRRHAEERRPGAAHPPLRLLSWIRGASPTGSRPGLGERVAQRYRRVRNTTMLHLVTPRLRGVRGGGIGTRSSSRRNLFDSKRGPASLRISCRLPADFACRAFSF